MRDTFSAVEGYHQFYGEMIKSQRIEGKRGMPLRRRMSEEVQLNRVQLRHWQRIVFPFVNYLEMISYRLKDRSLSFYKGGQSDLAWTMIISISLRPPLVDT